MAFAAVPAGGVAADAEGVTAAVAVAVGTIVAVEATGAAAAGATTGVAQPARPSASSAPVKAERVKTDRWVRHMDG
jgi:hypothetical protein